jgi:Xaa-Pro aminopeptidase
MFQDFTVKGGPAIGQRNLPKIREVMRAEGLNWLLVPHEDSYQNEYLPAAYERLGFSTGFTGSAGAAILGLSRAALFVDGRYTVQGRAQTEPSLFEQIEFTGAALCSFLSENLKPGEKVGYDGELHTQPAIDALTKAVEQAGGVMVATDGNLIDKVWTDQPALSDAPVTVQDTQFAGKDHDGKRSEVAALLRKQNADLTILTSPVSLAWLLNLRGNDVDHTPAPLGRVIVHASGDADLFIDQTKLTDGVRSHLGNHVALHDETGFWDHLTTLSGKRALVDAHGAPSRVVELLKSAGARPILGEDPCALLRATKNRTEIEGAKAAHLRDGVAMTRFLFWLDTEGQSGAIDEITAARTLEALRREIPELKDLSFESISAAGPNSALPHYRVNEASNRVLERGNLYLIDSGGQYPDGTTDITRTVLIGEASAEMKTRFTLVLKGHIALSMIRFPEGTTGSALDAFARQPLWMAGLDFDHGTGHGVGSYLSVHEGPQRISKAPNSVALRPGMILSNEPGYYREGHYGIRIENLQFVTEASPVPGGERLMLGFETLTLAPISRALTVTDLLTAQDRDWLNAYHARVLAEIGPRLQVEAEQDWLKAACAPV